MTEHEKLRIEISIQMAKNDFKKRWVLIKPESDLLSEKNLENE